MAHVSQMNPTSGGKASRRMPGLGMLINGLKALNAYLKRRDQYIRLLGMSDRMLSDMGLTRDDVYREMAHDRTNLWR